MFNGHTMSVVSDLNLIAKDIMNVNMITVAAITASEDYEKFPNIHYAGVLVPPTEILMRWADGDQLVMQNDYPMYLLSQDCDNMIIALIAAMTKTNIVLYIPAEEFSIFGQYLLNHIYYYYGIVCNTPFSKFAFDDSKYPFIISKFFMMDIMEPQDYLAVYPANRALPEWVINKLAIQCNPFPQGATFIDYANYFNSLVANKTQTPKEMVQMVTIADNNSGGDNK